MKRRKGNNYSVKRGKFFIYLENITKVNFIIYLFRKYQT